MAGKLLEPGRMVDKTSIIGRIEKKNYRTKHNEMVKALKGYSDKYTVGFVGNYDCVTLLYPLDGGDYGVWTYLNDRSKRCDVYQELSKWLETTDFVEGRVFVPDKYETNLSRAIRTMSTKTTLLYGDTERGKIKEAREYLNRITRLKDHLEDNNIPGHIIGDDFHDLLEQVKGKAKIKGLGENELNEIDIRYNDVIEDDGFISEAAQRATDMLQNTYRGRGSLFVMPGTGHYAFVSYRPLEGSEPQKGKIGEVSFEPLKRFLIAMNHKFDNADLKSNLAMSNELVDLLVDNRTSTKFEPRLKDFLMKNTSSLQLERYIEGFGIDIIRQASEWEVPIIGVIDDPKAFTLMMDMNTGFVDRLQRYTNK